MVNSVYTTFTITFCYLLMVWLTPKYMKNRPPHSLKNVLIIYNVLMILANLFIIIEVKKKYVYICSSILIHDEMFEYYKTVYFVFFLQLLITSTKLNYNLTCQPITYMNSESELRVNINCD